MASGGWELLRDERSPLQEFGSVEQMVPAGVVMCFLFADACSKLQCE